MKSSRWEVWSPRLVLTGGLLLTLLAARQQHRYNVRELTEATRAEAQHTIARSVTQSERAVLGLKGARGYLMGVGVDDATAEGFRAYMATRDLVAEFPGVLGHGFIRRVAPAEEQVYLERMRRQVAPDFAIRMLQPHEGERRVIQFIEPLEPNRAARGLDIASETLRRQASDLALQADMPVLTGPIRLLQSKSGGSLGMLLLLPMPAPPVGTSGPGLGVSRGPSGYVYAPIQLDGLLMAAGLRLDLVGLQVSDVTDAQQPQDFQLPSTAEPAAADLPAVTEERTVMHRRWRFTVQAKPALVQALHLTSPLTVGVAGTLASLLLALLMRLWMSLRRRRNEALVERVRMRTVLDHISDAIIGLDRQGRVMLWNQAATQIFGFERDAAMGRSLSELTLDSGHQIEGDSIIRTALAGQTTAFFETTRRQRNGAEVEVEVSAGPIYDARGRVVGVAKVLRPIRERIHKLRQLKAYGEDLEQQVAARTAQVEASRRDLRSVLDAMPSLVGAWDAQLRNRLANTSYAAYFGHTPDEIACMTLPELLGPELFVLNEPHVRAALAGEEQHFERELSLAHGEGTRHTLAHYLPYREHGEVVGFYVLVHDVTELKESQQQASAATRKADALLAMIHQHAIVSVTDPTGRIVDVNDAFCRISGYERHELIGQTHRVVYSGTQGAGFWSEVWRTIAGGSLWRGEVCNRAKEGSLYWVDSIIGPFFGETGNIENYISVRFDITQRKAAEAALIESETMLARTEEIAQVGGWELEVQTQKPKWSAGTCLIHGLPAGHQPTLAEAISYYSEDDRAVIEQVVSRSMTTGEPWDVEQQLVRADGRRIWVRARGSAELRDGKPVRLSGSIQDITELVQARQAAEAASTAKTNFLASTSHEIRSPLNAIIGLSYLLERAALPPEPLIQVHRIAQAGRALLGIVNDVLDLSKIEAGRLKLDEQVFDLVALVQGVLGLHAEAAQGKGLALALAVAPDLPPLVRGDAGRLQQILTNLLSNALKFTDRGVVRLGVRRGACEPMIEFEVSDSGIGIAPQVQPRLFHPFEQADSSTARRFGGTGLGLSIVAQLAQLMGGMVELHSELGHGSRFTASLPLSAAGPDEMVVPSPHAGAMRVLLAEGDNTPREQMAVVVRALGWQCDAVPDSESLVIEAGRAAHKRQPYDVLIIGGPLAGQETLQALERLRQQAPVGEWSTVLVVTQHKIEPVQRELCAALAATVLAQPIDAAVLFNAVRSSQAAQPNRPAKLLEACLHHGDGLVWLRGMRVLVVDDSVLNLEVARKVLEREGARVVTCESGSVALKVLAQMHESVDVVLLDVQMPGMDGVEVARHAREIDGVGELPIVALTAGVLREERERALAAGMNDFLPKPFDPRRMIACLRWHVERHTGRPLPVQLREGSEADLYATTGETLGIAGIDDQAITPALRSDRSLLLSMIRRLLDEYRDLSAVVSSELPARMHKLRGAAQVVGATAVAAAASRVETACARGPADAAQRALHELDVLLQDLAGAAQAVLDPEAQRLASARLDIVRQAATAEPISQQDFDELRELITSQAARARPLAQALAPALLHTLGEERVSRLLAALEEFDFQCAALVLGEQIEH